MTTPSGTSSRSVRPRASRLAAALAGPRPGRRGLRRHRRRDLRTARTRRGVARLDELADEIELGRQPDHPQRVDPAADGRRPLRHPAADSTSSRSRSPHLPAPQKSSRSGRRPRSPATATDGWMTEVVPRLQRRRHHAGRRLPGRRRPARHRLGHGLPVHRPRRGTPDGFTPSNQLWIEMAAEFQTMTEVRPVRSRTSPAS